MNIIELELPIRSNDYELVEILSRRYGGMDDAILNLIGAGLSNQNLNVQIISQLLKDGKSIGYALQKMRCRGSRVKILTDAIRIYEDEGGNLSESNKKEYETYKKHQYDKRKRRILNE